MKSIDIYKVLERAYLDGIINEVLLKIDNGIVEVTAIDMSNTNFLHVSEKIDCKDTCELGLQNIGLLKRYISDSKEAAEFKVTKKRAKIVRENGNQISVSLLEPYEVPTKVSGKSPETMIKKLKDSTTVSAQIHENTVDELLYYTKIIDAVSIVFVADEGSVIAKTPESNNERFKLNIGRFRGKTSATTEVPKQHISAVFKVLEFQNDEKPILSFSNDGPVIIEQNDMNMWAISPLASE